jgi:hypothetical protein
MTNWEKIALFLRKCVFYREITINLFSQTLKVQKFTGLTIANDHAQAPTKSAAVQPLNADRLQRVQHRLHAGGQGPVYYCYSMEATGHGYFASE